MIGKEKKPEGRDIGPGFEYYLERFNQQALGTNRTEHEPAAPKKAEVAREILCKLQETTDHPVMMTDLLSGSESDSELYTFVDAIYLLDKGKIINVINDQSIELTQEGEQLLIKLKESGMITD